MLKEIIRHIPPFVKFFQKIAEQNRLTVVFFTEDT